MSSESNDLGAFLAGFVIGGLIGAATAIILAPQSGQEMRAQIAAKGNELAHKGEEQYQHIRETATQYGHDYSQRATEAVHQTQEQARIVLARGKGDTTANGNGASEQVDSVEPTTTDGIEEDVA
jgi:gas vesicle protein